MSEKVFMFDSSDPEMQRAYRSAQSSFRYFWRELFWERRRIVSALGMATVKLPFTDGPRKDKKPEYEQMWIGDIGFDGDNISGTLLNSPNWLKSVREGKRVSAPFSHLTDWMMTVDDRAYGGFTVNLMRSRMKPAERDQHDQAWGLDFGDPNDIWVEIGQKPKPGKRSVRGLLARFSGSGAAEPVPEKFEDRPMCINMLPKIEARLQADPQVATALDGKGWSMLHHEAMAGNMGIVKLLVAYGANPAAQTPSGYTASDLAARIGWSEIAELIQI